VASGSEQHGWRFHAGVRCRADQWRLARYMIRRSWWATWRHGWRGTPGRACLAAASIGVLAIPVLWSTDGPTLLTLSSPLLLIAAYVVVGLPLVAVVSALIRLWMLRPHSRSWIAHWCEGPNGQLAVRMTRPASGESGARTRWPGRDLFGHAGAGVRLLRWLQQLADDQHATIIIATTVPTLVGYYQRAGFTVESERWLRLGEIVLAGKAVLSYPAPNRP
jgi:hypothetical protein